MKLIGQHRDGLAAHGVGVRDAQLAAENLIADATAEQTQMRQGLTQLARRRNIRLLLPADCTTRKQQVERFQRHARIAEVLQ